MAEREQLPAPGLPIPELRSPDHTQLYYRELVSRQDSRWYNNNPIKRGTLYSSLQGGDVRIAKAYPDLYFVRETVPLGSDTVAGMTQSNMVVWEWATTPDAESTFNAEVSYLADGTFNPVYARTYTIRRDVYDNGPRIVVGTPLTALIGVQIKNGGKKYKHADAEFLCGGEDAEIAFVINADGEIVSGIVTKEGTGFNPDSQITVVGDGSDAEAEPIIQPPTAILTSQKKVEFNDNDPMSHEFVKVLRVYEVLPGPWVPFTRYDDDLGPVQGRRRAVFNTGQLGGVITPTSKTNYEGRDGSSVVLIEIQENWTDGTNTTGNPPFPTQLWSTYADERGTVGHTSQVVLAVDNQPYTSAKLVRLAGKLTKTWFEPYQDNPALVKKFTEHWTEVTINDQELTSDHGGTIATVTETTDEPGAQVPVRGLLVVSSKTVTKSPDEQTLRTVQNPGTAWPELLGHHTDETSGIVINFTKQVIQAGTPYPGRAAGSDDCTLLQNLGPFVEDQPYDFDKTIRIITQLDLNTMPKKQCWTTLHPITLPPQLLGVQAVWTNFSGRTTSAQANDSGVHTTFVEAESGSNGGALVTSRGGFRGNAKARIERSYFYGPPNPGLIPVQYRIYPSSGSIVFMATSSKTNTSQSDNGGISFHDEFRSQAEVKELSGFLVGGFTISGQPGDTVVGNQLIHTSPAVGPITASPPTISIIALGTKASMTVSIPMSVPSVMPYGSEIVWDVDVREHPLGIWTMDVIFVTVPYPNQYPP